MSLCMAVVTLLAVVYANLASSEEGMGLCYRCPLHHSDGNEGSPFAWVKSFLQEIKRRCPDLETRLRTYKTPRSTTDPTTDPQSATTDTKSTTTNQQPSTNNPPATTTDLTSTMVEPPTTINNPSAKTTESPTSTTEPPTSTTDSPTTTTDPPTTTTDPQTTTADPQTTTTNSPTTPTEPQTTTDPQTTATDPYPQTTTTDPPTTTTDSPTTPTEPQTTTTKPGHPDCQALFDAGHTQSAVYNITPAQYPDGLEVYCDMTTDSKRWIVFQRRADGTVNFTRSWAEYRDGFGDKEGEFWLGNEILRRLTEPVDGEQGWEMRVDLNVANRTLQWSGVYADFHVDAESYTLHVGAFTDLTNIDDALSTAPEPPSNGQPFSTYDRDNDAEPSLNCADELKGGWWFNRCPVDDDDDAGPHSNLNGEYSQRSDPWVYGRGIVWGYFTGRITRTEMKMRRVP